MDPGQKTREQLLLELEELTARHQEAEETLEAIRSGGVDALVVATEPGKEQLFTLEGADRVYRVFLESMSEGAVTLGGDGLILYANAAAHRLLIGRPEGLVGGPLRDLVCDDQRRRFDALLERAGTAAAQAEICVTASPGRRPLSLSLHPLEDGEDRLVVAVLTDLAERKTTEAALESERVAGSIFDQAGETIVVCDKHGGVIRASRAAAELAGREPLFQSFDVLLPLWTQDHRRRILVKELSERGRVRGLEVRLDRADGASFNLVLNANPLTTAEHGLIGSVVTLTDITRLRQAEQTREALLLDLEQANKELGTIESLAHAGLQLTTVEQLAHSIASQVAIALEADETAVLLREGDQVQLAAIVPPVAGGPQPVDIGQGFIRTVMTMGRTLFVEDAGSSRLLTEAERARGNRSLLASPLLRGDDVIGALCVGWKQQHAAGVGQQRFLEIIAARAALGISSRMLADQRDEQRIAAETLASELAETNAQLISRQAVLQLLQELTTLATSSLSLPTIAERVLELAQQRLDLRAAAIYALDDAAGVLRALALVGFSADTAAAMQTHAIDDESSTGRVVHRGLPVVTHDSELASAASSGRLSDVLGTSETRWIVLPLKKAERTLGVVAFDFLGRRPFTADELALYRSIAELLGSAFDNARAYQAETDAKMRHATHEERTRLARDLHDSITQALFAASLKAEALMEHDDIPARAAETANEVRRLTRGALAQMRTLLLELRSETLADVPIEQLLRNVVEATEGRAAIAVDLRLLGDGQPPRELNGAIYRVTQEALNNVVRHSGATQASVDLMVEQSGVRLLVRDDGRGFEPGPVSSAHFGLRSMHERASEVGAELRIVSAPGEGTLVMLDWRDGTATGADPAQA
jgi:PAS domain S-box-containing protein